MGALPTFPDFVSHLNSRFIAHTRHGPVELILTDVRELERGQRPREFQTPVSLIFSSESPVVLLQDSYRLDHPVLGSHRLLIVPVVTGRPIPDYQAIFGYTDWRQSR